MPFGPGKYDDIATLVRDKTFAEGVVVLVIGGNKGSGFSAQLPAYHVFTVSSILRAMADEIEKGEGST